MINCLREGKIVYQVNGVTGRALGKGPGFELLKLEIEAGVTLAPHLVDFAAEFYVIAGRGRFIYQQEEITIGKDCLVSAATKTSRGFINEGEEVMEILVVKHQQ
ncbi:MAG: cupin domain-containing protein [Candidatus Rifleibacteriota bacterium]